MASSAEQLASSFNLKAFSKAQDLKKRIVFTLLALIVYRLGSYIPVPGIDPSVMINFVQSKSSGLMGMLDVLGGGSLSRMSIFTLALMPYISASIIVQLMSTVLPSFEALKKEGEQGRKKLNQYTRYGTFFLAAFQALATAKLLENAVPSPVVDPGLVFRISTIVSLVGGTFFLMWLGEQINARGIGQGVSIIIFAGIISNTPSTIKHMLDLGRTGALSIPFLVGFSVLVIGVIAFVVYIERAQRQILVQYPKRQVRNKVYGGTSTHLPMKINTAGVIPPIFASSLLTLPTTISGFINQNEPGILSNIAGWLAHGQPLYILLDIALMVFFCFFYTSIVFNPQETAENLRKNGGVILGIRPGKNTADYLDYVLSRLTVIGAIYICAICVMPEILTGFYSIPFYFGGTSLLIVVSVTMDTVSQVHSHLLAHQYENLLKKARLTK